MNLHVWGSARTLLEILTQVTSPTVYLSAAALFLGAAFPFCPVPSLCAHFQHSASPRASAICNTKVSSCVFDSIWKVWSILLHSHQCDREGTSEDIYSDILLTKLAISWPFQLPVQSTILWFMKSFPAASQQLGFGESACLRKHTFLWLWSYELRWTSISAALAYCLWQTCGKAHSLPAQALCEAKALLLPIRIAFKPHLLADRVVLATQKSKQACTAFGWSISRVDKL